MAGHQIFSFGYQSHLLSEMGVFGDWPLTHIWSLGLVISWEMPNHRVLKYANKVKTGTTKLPCTFMVHITTQHYFYWLQDVFFSPSLSCRMFFGWGIKEEQRWYGGFFLISNFVSSCLSLHTPSNVYTSIFEEAVEINQIMTHWRIYLCKQYGWHMALLFMNDSINCITKCIAIILQFIRKMLSCHWYSTSLNIVCPKTPKIAVLKIIKHIHVS